MASLNSPLICLPTNHNYRVFANHQALLFIDQCPNLNHLQQIHAHFLRTGLFFDPFSASKLITAIALPPLSSIEYARKVFDQIPQPNLFTWNSLIRAYSSSVEPVQSLLLFVQLLYQCNEVPNEFTFPFVIGAAARLPDYEMGRVVHGMAVKSALILDLFVVNSLIYFYATCGHLDLAYGVFISSSRRDIVSWNSMISGFSKGDCPDEALELFHVMQAEGVVPNVVTMVGVFSACAKKSDLKFGRLLHSYVEKKGIRKELTLCNTILDMYTKCGSMQDANIFFNKMPEKDIISWTTMIVGYAKLEDFVSARRVLSSMPCQAISAWNALISSYEQFGNPKEALAVFRELQVRKNLKPNEVTLVSSLAACSQLGALDLGKWIHLYMKKEGIKLSCHITTSLIDMYSKCGDLEKAVEVFESVKWRDVFVWSVMIAGFAMHGNGKDAIHLFMKMQESKVKPNAVTFTNLLAACSHTGLVDQGRELFYQMERVYGVAPGVKHYACMIDILGRAGNLEEATELINKMPTTPSASVWGALLGACRLHGNVDLAEQACAQLLELEPRNHGAYVLLSNVYAKLGEWDKVASLRKLMRDADLKKEPGCSSIEVEGTVHEFLVGDNSHRFSKEIYAKLDEISSKLQAIGYVPNKTHLLQLIEEEESQDHALYLHSEKLAIAFGLIHNSASQPIRIVKNLRVCGDCHYVAKQISKLYDRQIILRDRYRFHDFRNGHCSCKDYW